jgi:S1-C subfamily serine protease
VNTLRDLVPELMNPAQVTKVDLSLRLREKRTLHPPATVEAFVELAGGEFEQTVAEIDGKPLRDIVDAYAILLSVPADREITVKYTDNKTQRFRAKPVPKPDAIVRARTLLGITIEPLTPLLAERYRLATEDGMYVTEVLRDSVAARVGLEPGDVIVSLGRYQVRTLEDFATLLQMLPAAGRVRIGVIRGNQVAYGMLEL